MKNDTNVKNEKLVVKFKNGTGGGNKGIGVYIQKRLIEMIKGEGVDYKELDEELFEKFGLDKNGNKSRRNSISWTMTKMRNDGIVK